MVVESSTSGNIGYIGTNANLIKDIMIPKYRCSSQSSGYFNTMLDGSGTNVDLAGKSTYSKFGSTENKLSNSATNYQTYFSGAACSSGSGSTNPCYV